MSLATSCIYFKVANTKAVRADLNGRGISFVGERHIIAKMPDYE